MVEGGEVMVGFHGERNNRISLQNREFHFKLIAFWPWNMTSIFGKDKKNFDSAIVSCGSAKNRQSVFGFLGSM